MYRNRSNAIVYPQKWMGSIPPFRMTKRFQNRSLRGYGRHGLELVGLPIGHVASQMHENILDWIDCTYAYLLRFRRLHFVHMIGLDMLDLYNTYKPLNSSSHWHWILKIGLYWCKWTYRLIRWIGYIGLVWMHIGLWIICIWF